MTSPIADPFIGRTLGRFEILAEIGRGGMGVVYRGRDTRLNRDVAIKVLPPALVADAERRQRFIREAQTASRIEHPHVGVIHEVDETDGVTFLAMELIRGEKLSDVLARGGWSPIHAVSVATEVAEGLARAHDLGVIHRDVKPANVMIGDDGHAKIIDFGLARLLVGWSGEADETTTALTEPGHVMGTTSYMSPEQARGSLVDCRSDIFSFGVMVYEMLAGRRPFDGPSGIDTLHAILHAPAPPLPSLGPEAGLAARADLQRLVDKCLAKDPAARYQGLRDVVVDLRTARRRLESGSATAATLAPGDPIVATGPVRPARHRARVLRYGLPTVAVLTVAVGYFGLVPRPRAAILTDKDTILLTDWENTTGDAVLDGTLKTALAVQLEQSPFLSLFSDERVRETLAYMGRSKDERVTKAIAREICQRRGLKALLAGSVSPLGSHYVMAIEAIDARTGDVVARQQEEAESKEQVLRTLGRAATRLREKLGESLGSIQQYDAPLEQATTTSLEALQAFSLALKAHEEGDETEAITHGNRAIALDPNFARAHVLLAASHSNLDCSCQPTGEGESGLAIQSATRAFSLRNRVSEQEQLHIAYWYYSIATWEADKATEVLETLTRAYPRFVPGHINLASQYMTAGQYDKGIAEFRLALTASPSAYTYSSLADALMQADRLTEARDTCQQALDQQLDVPHCHGVLYTIAFVKGDQAGMTRQLDWAKARPGEARHLKWQAETAAFLGRARQARIFSVQAVAAAEGANLRQLAAGYAADQAATDAEFEDCERAKESAGKTVALTNTGAPYLVAVTALVRCGDTRRAEAFDAPQNERFPASTHNALVRPWFRALVALNRRGLTQARDLLEGAGVRRYERAWGFWLPYERGRVDLMLGKGMDAASEFQTILDHRGWWGPSSFYPLADVGLARAAVLSGDGPKARQAYEAFFTLWKDADPDVPILIKAKAEYARLR